MMHSVKTWKTPVSRVRNQTVGSARLTHEIYPPGLYNCYCLGPDGHDEKSLYYCVEKPINVKVLKLGGKVWMVDDAPHWWAMGEHAKHYSGRVLVAGLGLGLILHRMVRNTAITAIDVVERNPDVIEMMKPTLPAVLGDMKLRILRGDFYESRLDDVYDGVFYDLFVGDGRELTVQALRAMLEMKRRFTKATTFRIHGMSNDYLNQVTDAILHAPQIPYEALSGLPGMVER